MLGKELGFSAVHFRKYKADNPIGFKLEEIKRIAELLEVPTTMVLNIFFKSIPGFIEE